jgi:DNA-binding NarL/FixJ family response regulator
MSTRTVVVAHRHRMVAEGIRSALSAFPGIASLGAATSAAAAETLACRSDGLAIDALLPGAAPVVARLRRGGVRVVWIGDAEEQDEEIFVPPEGSISTLAEALVPGTIRPGPAVLSKQQRRVLLLIAQGMTAKQVARCLEISPKTVEQHKTRIFTKLGVPNQAAAVRVALGGSVEGVLA